MKLLALVAVALQTVTTPQSPTATPFVAMLGKARVDADCYGRRPCSAPIIEVPADGYSEEFRGMLTWFLLSVRQRKTDDPNFTQQDYSTFQLALNVLDPYWACLENRLAGTPAAAYADTSSINRIAADASGDCQSLRERGMHRINFDGPDFVTYDSLVDGDQPNADVSETLQILQRFIIAYYAGLHRPDETKG